MQPFLRKLLLFLSPIILMLVVAEQLLRNIPNDYAAKHAYYQQSGPSIQTLILGNSHAFYDLNPEKFSSPCFNGAHVAQTLDLDAKIFEKYNALLPNLKRVIISISDMSLFFKLAHSNETWRLKNYSLYYHIPTSIRISDYSEVLNQPYSINRNRLIRWYLYKFDPLTISSLGFGNNYNAVLARNLDSTAMEAAGTHTIKDYQDYPEELAALDHILEICAKRGIRVTLFLPPAYKAYRDLMPKQQLRITLHTCDSIQSVRPGVRFYNLLSDTSYKAEDYYDADHLNEKGAAKLSRTIDSF